MQPSRAFTDAKLRAMQPRETIYTVAIRPGLLFVVYPSGAKAWRFQPRLAGKRLNLSLGEYPDTSIAQAEDRLRTARDQIARGLHPLIEKRKAVADAVANQKATFASVHEEWFAQWAPRRSDSWRFNVQHWHKRFIAPAIGALPVADIRAPHVLLAVRSAEAATSLHAAHSVRRQVSAVLDHAAATGRAEFNVAQSLRRALPPHVAGQHAEASLQDVRELWKKLDHYEGTPAVTLALKLLTLTALRAAEVTKIERSWLGQDVITMPRAAMKMKNPKRGDFTVPLSPEARKVVREALVASPSARYVFPNLGSRVRPMSKSSLNSAMERMQLKFSPHSVRNALATWARETEAADEGTVEAALDHARGDPTMRAYDRAKLLEQRRALLAAWASAVTR